MSVESSSGFLIRKRNLDQMKVFTALDFVKSKENFSRSYILAQRAKIEKWLSCVTSLSDRISECFLEENVEALLLIQMWIMK